MRASSPSRRRDSDGVQKPGFERLPRAGSPLKALTVWQPWASLIILGAKPYEFRGWRFPDWMQGKRIVIHAAARKMKRDEVWGIIRRLEDGGAEAAATCLHPGPSLALLRPIMEGGFNPLALPLAAGLGTVVLGEPKNGYDCAEEFGMGHVTDRSRDVNWGWPVSEAEQWAEPIPMKGLQGFWGWPTPEDHQL